MSEEEFSHTLTRLQTASSLCPSPCVFDYGPVQATFVTLHVLLAIRLNRKRTRSLAFPSACTWCSMPTLFCSLCHLHYSIKPKLHQPAVALAHTFISLHPKGPMENKSIAAGGSVRSRSF